MQVLISFLLALFLVESLPAFSDVTAGSEIRGAKTPKLVITLYDSLASRRASKRTQLLGHGAGRDSLRKWMNQDPCVEREMFELAEVFQGSALNSFLEEENSAGNRAELTLNVLVTQFTKDEKREHTEFSPFLLCESRDRGVFATLTFRGVKSLPRKDGKPGNELAVIETSQSGTLLRQDTVSLGFDSLFQKVKRNISAQVLSHQNTAAEAKASLEKNTNHPILNFVQ